MTDEQANAVLRYCNSLAKKLDEPAPTEPEIAQMRRWVDQIRWIAKHP